MTARRGAETPASRLRRRGVRVSAGPWTACGENAPGAGGRLIVALGRIAGSATTRSRIRRIARDMFADKFGCSPGMDLLLLARSDVSGHPRRQIRASLAELLTRLANALARRQADTTAHG